MGYSDELINGIIISFPNFTNGYTKVCQQPTSQDKGEINVTLTTIGQNSITEEKLDMRNEDDMSGMSSE